MDPKVRVRRRNGQIVPWQREKIEIAIRKALLAEGKSEDHAAAIAAAAERRLLTPPPPHAVDIESIQDAIQNELLLRGEEAVARAYATYRRRREEQRDRPAAEEDGSQQALRLVHRSGGELRRWGDELWRRWLALPLAESQFPAAADELLPILLRGVPDELSAEELRDAVLTNVLRRCKEDPSCGRLAAAIGRQFLRDELLAGCGCGEEDGQAMLVEQFPHYMARAMDRGLLDRRLAEMDWTALAQSLDGTRDRLLDWSGFDLLHEEFLLRDGGKIIELPQWFWMRVAMGLHVGTGEEHRQENIAKLYGALSRLEFCPASTVLLYAGTPHPQLLPSYIYALEDNMEDIMLRGIAENAFASRWGAGLGGSWSKVRGRGAAIGGSRGISEGIGPFLDLHRHQLSIANQGSHRRPGAGCAYLDLWHCDVEEFIGLGKKFSENRRGQREPELRSCLWIPDLFMERLAADGPWTLFQPNEVPQLLDLWGEEFAAHYGRCERLAEGGELWSKRISAKELWQKILAHAFECGFPSLAFGDNFQRPRSGRGRPIKCSSLFGESAVAMERGETVGRAFGTISLPAQLGADGSFDWDRFRRTVHLAVRTLDNVLCITHFPSQTAARTCGRYRALCLGPAGLHDLFRRRGIAFDGGEAERLAAAIFECLAHGALEASAELAAERGPCGAAADGGGALSGEVGAADRAMALDWDGLRALVKKNGLRNGYLLACAPTARTSALLAVSPGALPIARNVRVLRLPGGERIWSLDPLLAERLRAEGLWNGDLAGGLCHLEGDVEAFPELPEGLRRAFATAFDYAPEKLLSMAATIQRRIDQSQYLPFHLRAPTFHQLSSLMQLAWEKGIKVIGPLITRRDLLRERARAKLPAA
jgi:ribonucleoside-diphosphate reductase alpha chain